MAQFVYLARLNNGERKEGEISADSYKNAMEQLVLKNYSVVKLNEKDTSFDFINPFLDRFNLAIEKLKNKVSLSVLVFFTRQLSTMFSAGLTIEKAIHFLALEEKNKKFKTMLIGIENTIKKGLSLSDSLLRHPGVFSNIYISLVKAGEVSGKLYETLDELSLYLETIDDTQRKVKSAMYYPVFIIIFLITMLFATFTWIIPRFSEVYDSLGSDLPYYTILMVQVGDWFQGNIIFIIFISLISLLIIWLFTLTDSGSLIRDQVLLRLPIFGSLIKQSILSKFSKTFGLLIGSGVSVLDAMKLLTKVVDNRVYEIAIIEASKSIENGISISKALRDTGKFPPILIQLLNTGEETGQISDLSLKASEFYTKQVNATVDRLTSLIEPLLVVLVGAVIGAIVIVTYLPIFHFGEAIGN